VVSSIAIKVNVLGHLRGEGRLYVGHGGDAWFHAFETPVRLEHNLSQRVNALPVGPRPLLIPDLEDGSLSVPHAEHVLP